MAIRLSLSFAGLALIGLAACASLVTLDNVDPTSTSSTQSSDSGVTGTGSATAGGVLISPTSITIPNVRCGSQGAETITLTNPSDTDAPYQMSLSNTTSFQLGTTDAGTASGTVPAKGHTTVTLLGLGTAPGNDSATIVVNIGDDVQQISATVERQGALLTITPSSFDFGQVRDKAGSQPAPVIFENDGNAPITITFPANGDSAQFTIPASITIPNGGQATGQFTLNASTAQDPAELTAVLTPTSADAYCGNVPTLTLTGRRMDTDVTVTPVSADFGNQGCGSTPSTQKTITISNYAQQPVPYTATLDNGSSSQFTIVSASNNGMVPASADGTTPATSTVVIQPKAAGDVPGPVNEGLTIVAGQSGVSDVTTGKIALTETVVGALFQLSSSYTFFGQRYSLLDIPTNKSSLGTITNVGNASACVSFSITDNQDFQAYSVGAIDGQSSTSLQVGFSGCNDTTATLSINHASCGPFGGSSAPLCGTQPTLQISGKGECTTSSSGSNGSNGHP